jgi:host factor-I protein
MDRIGNLQDTFLNLVRRERAQLTGRLKGFDKYSLILDGGGQDQMIFKHAVSTVALPKGIHFKTGSDDEATEAVETVQTPQP